MKCPTCGYLGFEEVDRCRNCGHSFVDVALPSLPDPTVRLGSDTLGVLGDLPLGAVSEPILGSPELAPVAPGRAVAVATPRGGSVLELPLFGPEDSPLIATPSPPRQPLSVRRATPEQPRPRSQAPRTPTLNWATEEAPITPTVTWPSEVTGREGTASPAYPVVDAGVVARLTAVLIDVLVLGAIDLIVVYLTMRICGVELPELRILPALPLSTFLAAQNIAYLTAFTAGGQTLGKMAVGLRVVPDGDRASVGLGRALAREVLWLVLALPAGLGFLTVLGGDHRGLHDRFAGTRVVQ